jgi:hypothetical protein
VRDVAGVNFCEEFEPAAVRKSGESPPPAKKRFDQLFGD